MARRCRQLVPLLRQRELGVRRGGPDAPALCQHQRSADQGSRPQIPLGPQQAAPGRPSRPQRSRPLMAKTVAERAAVLPVLGEVFREHGFEGASLSLIGERTGLGKGSLYLFFPGGKEEMATAVLAEI